MLNRTDAGMCHQQGHWCGTLHFVAKIFLTHKRTFLILPPVKRKFLSIQFNSISISISPDSFIVRRAVNLFMGALSNFLAISIDNSVKFNIIQKEKSEGCRLMNVVGFL